MKLKQKQMNYLKLMLKGFLARSRDHKKDKAGDLLKRIYKDKNGNIYFGFRDPRQMPANRLRVGEIAGVEAELCLSSTDGSMLVDKVITDIETWAKSPKSTGLANALSVLVELKRRFESLAEEETLLKLATVYFVMNKEDPYHYNTLEQQAKKDAWNIDGEAKDFFLCRAAEITNFYGTTSDKDILMYLKQNQPELKEAARFLKKSGLSNT